jgi:hypothetical protein
MTDWSDPCARAVALRDAYFERLQGGTQSRVRFRAGDNEQELQSGHSAQSLTDLRREMHQAEDECRASQGLAPRPRRFAITAGSRRG